MDEQQFAADFLQRLNLNASKQTRVERWFDMLNMHWEHYDRIVRDAPASSPYKKFGWTPDLNGTSQQDRDYARCVIEDTKLLRIWTALGNLRSLWDDRWLAPYFIEAQDALIDAFHSTGGKSWQRTLCMTPSEAERKSRWNGTPNWWLYLWDAVPGETDYTFNDWLIHDWLAWEAKDSVHQDELAYIMVGRSPSSSLYYGYDWRQKERRLRHRIAVQAAARGIRRQALAGATDFDESELNQAIRENPDGSYEGDRIIWYPDATPEHRADWDAFKAQHGIR